MGTTSPAQNPSEIPADTAPPAAGSSTAGSSTAGSSTAGSSAAGGSASAPAGGYDHSEVEAGVRELWEKHDVYRFERAGDAPVFSVDTPPPYVSAAHLHVGHAMSYAQADFVVRYRRMRGERVFYPIGFDDNGLPTERYVEQAHGVRAADLPRAEFVAMCLAETARTAQVYERLWRQLGLSVDWSLRYSTIDERCQRTAQAGFLALHDAGHIRRAEDPVLWCPQCQTALAQADVEDTPRTGAMHQIEFAGEAGQPLVIATTRPELLPGAVALYHHPDDERYRRLTGTGATVPLSGHRVQVRSDPTVDPERGTGLMMVCTFGDGEDVTRWRRDGLPLRMVVTGDGRLGEAAAGFAGLPLARARSEIVAALAETGALLGTVQVRQAVGVHERCHTPVEFQIRPQWFVAVTGHRQALRQRAAELTWVPPAMRRRLEDWIDGLKWDWNLSRQRHYGVPFPAWFCRDCQRAVLAEPASLPVDPVTDPPPVPACPGCAGPLVPDPDVMDTWMTSSLSPQINDGWASGGPDPRLAPMSLRVQGFEIIRTWLFYTLVQSHLLFDRLPWRAVMISGWGLNEQGRKIAKRDLTRAEGGYHRYAPEDVIGRYGADALRLWATGARIGADLRYHERDVRAGRKLVVKLWNVARFVTGNAGDRPAPEPLPPAERSLVDRWLLAHLAETVEAATAKLDEYEPTAAHQLVSRFFWSLYCDRYIEMVKPRFLHPAEHSETDRESARATLRESLRVLLGLFAPFAPYLTEHLYQRLYRPYESAMSLHCSAWPVPDPGWRASAVARTDVDQLVVVLDRVRALRSGLRLGAGSRLSVLRVEASTQPARRLLQVIAQPLRAAARADRLVEAEAGHDSGVPGLRVDISA